MIYCTCGHLLVESKSSQNSRQWRLDALSIPYYVIKKEILDGARHGKTDAQKERRELVKKIENYPHRQSLQRDLQQSNAYNPFSEKSKKMMKDMGDVELFELCETIPKVQCSECLLYWHQGIVYCTCGHLLRENQSSQKFNKLRLDALSIPHSVIKKGRPHGNRHGKTEAQKEHFIAHNTRKRCIRKGFEGIHDRFQKDLRFRDSQLKIDRTEAKSIEMDEVAQKDFTYYLSFEEFERYKKTWCISLNTSGRNAPMKLRSDFSEALTKMHRLHRESGEERLAPVPSGRTRNGIRRLLHPAHHGGSGTITCGAHDFIKVKYL